MCSFAKVLVVPLTGFAILEVSCDTVLDGLFLQGRDVLCALMLAFGHQRISTGSVDILSEANGWRDGEGC